MKIRNLEWPARGLLCLVISASALSAAVVPVVRLNPASPRLETLRHGPALASYRAATNYLAQVPQAAHILQQLEKSATTYRVEILDQSISGSVATGNEF